MVLKVPTLAPRFISTRSYKRYKADQFSNDMEQIPWDTINLMESVDEKLDAFNDLFLAGLDSHAPIKTVKLRRKANPAITPEIKELITKRKINSMRKFGKVDLEWTGTHSCVLGGR